MVKFTFRARLEQVARKGLDAMEELLDMTPGVDKEEFAHAHLRAKIGANAVSNHVRHFSAENQREAIDLQARRMQMVIEGEEAPALKLSAGTSSSES